MKQIVIIGDSHTRGFAFRDNIIPVFLGPGKEINLDPKNRNQIFKKLKKIKRMFPIDRYDIYLRESQILDFNLVLDGALILKKIKFFQM
jgi:hypothetical protein